MNAKKAKVLRAHFKPIMAEYASTYHPKRFTVFETGPSGMRIPKYVFLRVAQTRLKPGCSRSNYQRAKRMYVRGCHDNLP